MDYTTDLDETLIEYMKKRAEYVRLVSAALAAQCLIVAVFFCAYGLRIKHFVFGGSEDLTKHIIICVAIVLTICISVFNVMVCIKYKRLAEERPDAIALRQSKETVYAAYYIARPILIHKVTVSLAIMFLSGLIYIIVVTVLKRAEIAGMYGRIIVCVAMAISVQYGLPSLDRIESYRSMTGERHVSVHDSMKLYWYSIVAAVGIPVSLCIWYILRYFSEQNSIAWIVFPIFALFGFAIAFLINWSVSGLSRQ